MCLFLGLGWESIVTGHNITILCCFFIHFAYFALDFFIMADICIFVCSERSEQHVVFLFEDPLATMAYGAYEWADLKRRVVLYVKMFNTPS